MIISIFYFSRYLRYAGETLQMLWQVLCIPHLLFQMAYIGYVSQQLAMLLVYGSRDPLRSSRDCVLSASYQLHCPDLFQGISELGCSTDDCRNDGKQTISNLELPRRSSGKQFGELFASLPSCLQLKLRRNHVNLRRLSIPNILFHCKKLENFLCLLSPKTVQYRSVYNRVAFQTSSLICQSPADANPCGVFCYQ